MTMIPSQQKSNHFLVILQYGLLFITIHYTKRLLEMFYFVPSLIIFAIDVERLREVPINIIPSSPYNKNYY